MSCVYVFFFKQKTAYEMRISDWSSDVCSSDLRARGGQDAARRLRTGAIGRCHRRRTAGFGRRAAAAALCAPPGDRLRRVRVPRGPPGAGGGDRGRGRRAAEEEARLRLPGRPGAPGLRRAGQLERNRRRSEEHTSELQSLMRTSTAVFCLKKKNTKKNRETT